jgi:hypothetical protein
VKKEDKKVMIVLLWGAALLAVALPSAGLGAAALGRF